ncbi:MAG: flippase, partial [Methanosarcinales archaeon]
MSEILDESLKKIVKGTGIVFVGTIIGMLLAFISRLIIIRYLSQSEYGAFSLGLALMNIFVFISTLGLQQGIPRYMGYFRGKNEKKIWSVISSSLQLSMVSSIFISFFSYFSSGFFADFFNIPELSIILKIFAIAIPFFALINIFVSIFRGFDRVDVKVYFRDILRNILTIIFFVLIVIFGLSFVSVMYAYTAAIIITAIFFAIYSIKRLFRVKEDEKSESMRKSLLFFSIPLLAQGFLIMVMSWTDTLMLGYFKTADIVGLYNAALPLSRLIPLFLTSLVFIYVPIVSQLYSKNLIEEMRRNYAVLTKWILSATLPVFLTLFLFPSTVLNFFFGYRYIQADFALQIL